MPRGGLDALGLGDRLDLAEGLLEERLLESRLGELLVDVLGDGLDEGGLLGLALLLLVADPRVEDRLELGLDGVLLGEEEVLVLNLVGVLGNGVELLGEGDNVLDLLDLVDAAGNSRGVLSTGAVEDALDALNVGVGPRRVGSTDRRANAVEDDEEGNGKNGLLVGNL